MVVFSPCYAFDFKEKLLLARYLYSKLGRLEGVEVGSPPHLSIVLFRFVEAESRSTGRAKSQDEEEEQEEEEEEARRIRTNQGGRGQCEDQFYRVTLQRISVVTSSEGHQNDFQFKEFTFHGFGFVTLNHFTFPP